MDVVNGKIVSVRTERCRGAAMGSALKPSRGLLEGPCPYGKAAAAGAADQHTHRSPDRTSGGGGGGHFYNQAVRGAVAFQPEWEPSRGPEWVHAPPQHHQCSSGAGAGAGILSSGFTSRALLDEELEKYESLISRALSGHFHRFQSPRSLAKTLPSTTSPPVCVTSDEQQQQLRHGAAVAPNPLKRPRPESPSGLDQVDAPWIAPLRFLLRKVMSVSDVGELGRIVLPKKDAEGQLPQIDTKGKQLEMKDHISSKSWFFLYKWWVNNKSRMYVLENTGDFIKHYGLKANDSFVVYEDACGNLVARGQKKLTWIPQLDAPVQNSKLGSTDVKTSEAENATTATENANCFINCSIPHAASSPD